MSHARVAALGAMVAAVVPIGVAVAAKPQKNSVSLTDNPKVLTAQHSDTFSGQLTGPHNVGVSVDLQAEQVGGTHFSTVATTTTGVNGTFTFAPQRPLHNTNYRAQAKASPTVTSSTILLPVRFNIGLHLGDTTPAKGQRVRFSGRVTPADGGKPVLIQRLTSTGWHTVTRAFLKNSTKGNYSTYAKRIRITRSATWRAHVGATTLNRANNSPRRKETVH